MEPKLLTEAEVDRFFGMPWQDIKAELRERGLIAPEVDPPPILERHGDCFAGVLAGACARRLGSFL